ncbi:hypothetical protein KP509_23G085400 [Ceratopteris richardii]|uniref:Tetratricopeptide repeat protein 5 OB fold domain-containing protein n=1 Tax=Ceratopteris richardii TaxID=49495 RepID=A0A8T2S1V2_CERRI|nr:hypothetical protein KP509_23G085400 [Ceratopteris richardii]KAH7302739.1 hypothetical protein KP509_23G085400 [Ceratopteris richardii]
MESLDDEDPLTRAAIALEELYLIRDTFFSSDPSVKKERLDQGASQVLALLDSVPLEHRKPSSRRALFEYLRGKALDVGSEYSKEAEDHLSKAVKLDPSLSDAWSCLGNCFWKKDDLIAAKNCFVLVLKKGPDKKILRQLSMLERRIAKGSSNEAEVVEESIKHAKNAVSLDVKDGQSWYTLGNAYLTSFFVTGTWDQSKLHQSLKAYQNAEKDELANSNPDLYFNCATVNRYLEDYERALKGFHAASLRDPGLHADEEVEKLTKLLARLEDAMVNKGWMKGKKLANLLSTLPLENATSDKLKQANIATLQEGLNRGIVMLCKCVFSIRHENPIPLYYLLADAEGSFFVLSVYSLREGLIKEGDTITLFKPCFRHFEVHWHDKVYRFSSVRVDFPQQIHVNLKPTTPQDAVFSTIHAEHVPP